MSIAFVFQKRGYSELGFPRNGYSTDPMLLETLVVFYTFTYSTNVALCKVFQLPILALYIMFVVPHKKGPLLVDATEWLLN